MRPIKFRAWCKEDKRMYWNVQNAYDTLACHNFPETCDDKDIECDHDFMPSSFGSVLNNEDYVVMQFTGLHDKNGVEVWEGDVIEVYNEQYKVFQEESGAWHYREWREFPKTGVIRYDLLPEEIQVLGNIYENPELVK